MLYIYTEGSSEYGALTSSITEHPRGVLPPNCYTSIHFSPSSVATLAQGSSISSSGIKHRPHFQTIEDLPFSPSVSADFILFGFLSGLVHLHRAQKGCLAVSRPLVLSDHPGLIPLRLQVRSSGIFGTLQSHQSSGICQHK